jgi:hypothetical protein
MIYVSPCGCALTACNNVRPELVIVRVADPGPDLERRMAMEPPWRPPPAPVVPRFRELLAHQRPEFHARSNPRSR